MKQVTSRGKNANSDSKSRKNKRTSESYSDERSDENERAVRNFFEISRDFAKSMIMNKSAMRIETLKSSSQNVTNWFENFELLTRR